jgi:Domain of unknown function (DUF4193)
MTAMSGTPDYDAPRPSAVEADDDGAQGLTASRTAGRSPTADLDEPEAVEGFDLPGSDMLDGELTVAVVPMRPDEFRCSRCFLVHHGTRLAERTDSGDVCQDCA